MADVIQQLNIKEPVRLPSAIMVAAALKHTGGAITGSCASDLFCTATLKKHPFPLDFGTAGDGAWSLLNAGRIHWAATPEKVTTFRRHPTMASACEVKVGGISNRFAQLVNKMVPEWLESGQCDASVEVCEHIRRLMSISMEHEARRRQYDALRKGKWPWILNPAAWQARRRRNQMKSKACHLMQKIICRAGMVLVLWTAANG
jgi:hypothetical protein